MENQVEKSYNPFKMWGSWIGLIVGIIGIFGYLVTPYLIDLGISPENLFIGNLQGLGGWLMTMNPIFWLSVLFLGEGAIGLILVIALTTPLATFFYGWGVHSIFRKLDRFGRIVLTTIIIISFLIFCIFVYINTMKVKQSQINYLNADIQDAKTGLLDMTRTIYHMRSVASVENIPVNIRLEALEVLVTKVNLMSVDEKKILGEQLIMLNDQLNKSTELSQEDLQRMLGKIVELQDLLKK